MTSLVSLRHDRKDIGGWHEVCPQGYISVDIVCCRNFTSARLEFNHRTAGSSDRTLRAYEQAATSFALGSAELLPAGLSTPMARDLGITAVRLGTMSMTAGLSRIGTTELLPAGGFVFAGAQLDIISETRWKILGKEFQVSTRVRTHHSIADPS